MNRKLTSRLCIQVVIKKADGETADATQEDTKPEVIDLSDNEDGTNGKNGSESPKKKPKVESAASKKRKSSVQPKKEKKKAKKEIKKKVAPKKKTTTKATKGKGKGKAGADDKEEKMKVVINVQQVRFPRLSFLFLILSPFSFFALLTILPPSSRKNCR